MYRQGDILLVPYKINGKVGKVVGKGMRVLAYGEATGHSHVMDGDVTYVDNGNGLLAVQVHSHAQLTHEEHGKVDVGKGEYLIIRQKELDIVGEVRRVAD